jgi:DNA adenine methylase
MDFFSPLRYPGGKGKVATFIHQVYKENSLYDGVYVEPYAGGASVALSLLYNEYVRKIIINDKDRSLYAFWHSVLNDTDNLCKLIHDTDISVNSWDIQRQVQRQKNDVSLLELGFSTFFLNRCNRSGIILAGIIGGRSQEGNWKIDARFNKKKLIDRIIRVANYRSRIELHNQDAITLINDLKPVLSTNALFYLDPPYYIKGKELYMNHYGLQDHIEIGKCINEISAQKWIVSYDNVQTIRNLYIGYKQLYYHLNYTAGNRSQGKEVIIFSDNLYIPGDCKLKLTNYA